MSIMDLNIRKDYKYAVACPTSMGVRITPANRMAVHNSNQFYMQATSAESNVLNVSSSLGKECLVLTKFVKGSPSLTLSRATCVPATSLTKALKWIRAVPGASVISSTSLTPVSVCAHPASGTTAPAKLAEP